MPDTASVSGSMNELAGEQHLLIAGVTTRPFAVSAARAGYRVSAIDAFGDLDLRAVADVVLARPDPGEVYGPFQAAALAKSVSAGLVAYTSNFENYPAAVARLANGRRLLGNAAPILARVRNPLEVMRVLHRHDLVSPESRSRAPKGSRGVWLLKPRRSGGGHGVVHWSPGEVVPRGMYLQQWIGGTAGSISFAADGSSAVVLGLSRQLVGDRRLGTSGFRYCGSILGNSARPLFPRQKEILERASQMAAVLTREFGLQGLNGVDFIARKGTPYPIEVNPRYSASMELVERAHNLSMFTVHAQACAGELPTPPSPGGTIVGKAIVFARHDTVTPDLRRWLGSNWLADVPPPGQYIRRGRPICTVFAEALHPESCRQLLTRRARLVYRAVKSFRRQAA
jgi:predicted ATP-grasp superfamily ATP-dependent carboligase